MNLCWANSLRIWRLSVKIAHIPLMNKLSNKEKCRLSTRHHWIQWKQNAALLNLAFSKTLANKVNYWICLVAFTWHTRISVRALGSSDEAKSQHPESLQPWMTVCEVYRTCSCLLWRGNVFQRICQCIQAGVIMTRLLFYSQYDCSLQ